MLVLLRRAPWHPAGPLFAIGCIALVPDVLLLRPATGGTVQEAALASARVGVSHYKLQYALLSTPLLLLAVLSAGVALARNRRLQRVTQSLVVLVALAFLPAVFTYAVSGSATAPP